MALQFPPKPGLVVICDYDTGFREPEMVKRRLAVVMSPRLPHRDRLCTVVPLSASAPRSGIRYQCKVELPVDPPPPFEGRIKWAKADMLATVSYNRLQLPYNGRDQETSRRKYRIINLKPADMRHIRIAMMHALGLDHLTDHL